MLKPVTTVRCNYVVAQVTLGYYDAEGHLVAEETFPQTDDKTLTARLYYPYAEELTSLIDLCVQQAWEKLDAGTPATQPKLRENGRGPVGTSGGISEAVDAMLPGDRQ